MVVIEKATNRISKIVNGLRKFARASDSVDLKLHSLAEIVRDATIMTEAKSKRHSTKIELSLQTEESVLCDAIEIGQVVINLINNGIDAVKQSDERWLKIALFKEHQEIVVQVIDSGKGISREIETKLFQPFFTTKPVGEGTGLGLSICKGILDHHKATLRVNHDLPNTCFEIRFRSDSPEEF
jgi:C4-dicarboxylate-specific signal transduction histidine kinase